MLKEVRVSTPETKEKQKVSLWKKKEDIKTNEMEILELKSTIIKVLTLVQ